MTNQVIHPEYRSAVEPVVFVRNHTVFASSKHIADFFGKRHDNVLRDIDNLLRQEPKMRLLNFEETTIDRQNPIGGATIKSRAYNMNRDGFTLIAMGFTGKRALAWKLKYIEAFNAMEAIISQPIMVADDDQPRTRKPSIDKMDAGMDLLITAETAMHAQGYLDGDTITAIRGTIGQAIKLLSPVREAVNRLS